MSDHSLSHVDENGRVSMVDTSSKPVVHRVAVAEGFFVAAPGTLDQLMDGQMPKGDALATARIAGIQAAKDCDRLIPLCHGLPLDQVVVDFERSTPDMVRIRSSVTVVARTGVEMEPLNVEATAISSEALGA